MNKIGLEGQWTLTRIRTGQQWPASVPGCVHTDLLEAGEIPDPFYRDQELDLQWIGEESWAYSRTFQVTVGPENREGLLLCCDGLDTLARVEINGQELGRTDNMYRRWEWEVGRLVQDGENTLTITFDSAVQYVKEKEKDRFLAGFGAPGEVQNRGWLRKAPCNFGWDWGPTLVTCGIWRDIYLLDPGPGRIDDVEVRQEHKQDGRVFLEIKARHSAEASLACQMALSLRQGEKEGDQGIIPCKRGQASARFEIENPQLWWPNGMGEQPLYHLRVELQTDSGETLDVWERRLGLRTLNLVRRKDEWGESFHFEANGKAFFAKGANYIPADVFYNRAGWPQIESLLTSMVDAHMNMIRIWGGGIYERDFFYELCDEKGICVWQDFMFACSTYPFYDKAFLENCRQEAVEQIKRLRHHPSLALFCGNNELEQGLVGPEWEGNQMSWRDYSRFFDKALAQVVEEKAPQIDYWPGSPHTPRGDRYDFNNADAGDAHLWDVWHGKKPFEWYYTSFHRFCSEFGLQSFPEPRTVEGCTAPEDRNLTSWVMEHHQRCGTGNALILNYLLDWFQMPKDFESLLWLSQISQALAMRYAVTQWRSQMPRCMGALYWQLNDCWPVASWASIDYHGRWKALHYEAKRFFNPLLVTGQPDWETGRVPITVVNDHLHGRELRCQWDLTDLTGKNLLSGHSMLEMPAQKALQAEELELGNYLKLHGSRNLLLWLSLWEGTHCHSQSLLFFARPKHMDWKEPQFSLSLEAGKPDRLMVETDVPAPWVWLEDQKGEARFSDNFFPLHPDRAVEVQLDLPNSQKPPQVERFVVHSLWETF